MPINAASFSFGLRKFPSAASYASHYFSWVSDSSTMLFGKCPINNIINFLESGRLFRSDCDFYLSITPSISLISDFPAISPDLPHKDIIPWLFPNHGIDVHSDALCLWIWSSYHISGEKQKSLKVCQRWWHNSKKRYRSNAWSNALLWYSFVHLHASIMKRGKNFWNLDLLLNCPCLTE